MIHKLPGSSFEEEPLKLKITFYSAIQWLNWCSLSRSLFLERWKIIQISSLNIKWMGKRKMLQDYAFLYVGRNVFKTLFTKLAMRWNLWVFLLVHLAASKIPKLNTKQCKQRDFFLTLHIKIHEEDVSRIQKSYKIELLLIKKPSLLGNLFTSFNSACFIFYD